MCHHYSEFQPALSDPGLKGIRLRFNVVLLRFLMLPALTVNGYSDLTYCLQFRPVFVLHTTKPETIHDLATIQPNRQTGQ